MHPPDSIADTQTSPSPCAACASPAEKSAPFTKTGRYRVVPAIKYLQSIFPPFFRGGKVRNSPGSSHATPITPQNCPGVSDEHLHRQLGTSSNGLHDRFGRTARAVHQPVPSGSSARQPADCRASRGAGPFRLLGRGAFRCRRSANADPRSQSGRRSQLLPFLSAEAPRQVHDQRLLGQH